MLILVMTDNGLAFELPAIGGGTKIVHVCGELPDTRTEDWPVTDHGRLEEDA